jgi:hypothetical protein
MNESWIIWRCYFAQPCASNNWNKVKSDKIENPQPNDYKLKTVAITIEFKILITNKLKKAVY